MTGSRAQALALRRRLLQAEASIQRVRLQRDAALLVDAANPASWMRRLRPHRVVAGALLAWQLWRRLQRRKPGHP